MTDLLNIAKECGAKRWKKTTNVWTGDYEHINHLTDDQLHATVEKVCGPLVEALKHSRGALEIANMVGAINDTLWATKTETLFDYMDSAIDAHKQLMGQDK